MSLCYFFRHGEREEHKVGYEALTPLSETAIKKLLLLKDTLGFRNPKNLQNNTLPKDTQTILGYCPGEKRFCDTLSLLLFGQLYHKETHEQYIFHDASLLYGIGNDIFQKSRENAEKKGKLFERIIYESDTFSNLPFVNVSTYKTMVATIRKKLLFMDATNNTSYYCAREYFYPCFRAWITEKLYGSFAMDQYIKRYESMDSESDDMLYSYSHIEYVLTESKYILCDLYGTIEFEKRILRD